MRSTILIIKADDTERELLKNMLVAESFEVMDFKNSMQAILWLKKNTPPAAVVIEEMAAPMDAHATAEYIAKELKLSVPIGILAPVQNGKMAATETNYITGPLDANTIFQIKGLMKKSAFYDIKIEKNTSFSLTYLEDIYEGDKNMITDALVLFKNSVAHQLEEIGKCLDANNLEDVRKIAHNIKPSFEMLENVEGKNICNLLAHECSLSDIPTLVEDLNTEYLKINADLADYLPNKNLKTQLS